MDHAGAPRGASLGATGVTGGVGALSLCVATFSNQRTTRASGSPNSASRARIPRMNALLRPKDLPITTQAAEGLPRRRFSVAEIEAMVRAGVIDEDERFELIGGEVVPMSPKGARHESIKIELNRFFQRVTPEHLAIAPETTPRLDAATYLEPDFCVFRRDLDLTKLDGPSVLLAIEVADSSLTYDRGRKIGVYSGFGVRAVWVIDATRARTWLHRRRGAEGYGEIIEAVAGEPVTPILAGELAVRLSDLGISAAQEEL